jgi:hypothetical protein
MGMCRQAHIAPEPFINLKTVLKITINARRYASRARIPKVKTIKPP